MHPTTELLLAHQHPDDRATVAAALATAVRDGIPFCSRHRILDTAGTEHHVLVIGDRLYDNTGATIGTAGYYVDLGADPAEQRQQVLDDTVPDLIEARARIEQAKGALMLVYGISAEHAFAVLRWRSQETNMKRRELADRLVVALPALDAGPPQAAQPVRSPAADHPPTPRPCPPDPTVLGA